MSFPDPNETVLALWNGVLADGDPLDLPDSLSCLGLERFTYLIAQELADFGCDDFDLVGIPASRTGQNVIGLRIGRALKRRLALAARNDEMLHVHADFPA